MRRCRKAAYIGNDTQATFQCVWHEKPNPHKAPQYGEQPFGGLTEYDANKQNSQNKPSGIDAHIKQLHKQFSHSDAPSESGQSSAASPEFHRL